MVSDEVRNLSKCPMSTLRVSWGHVHRVDEARICPSSSRWKWLKCDWVTFLPLPQVRTPPQGWALAAVLKKKMESCDNMCFITKSIFTYFLSKTPGNLQIYRKNKEKKYSRKASQKKGRLIKNTLLTLLYSQSANLSSPFCLWLPDVLQQLRVWSSCQWQHLVLSLAS